MYEIQTISPCATSCCTTAFFLTMMLPQLNLSSQSRTYVTQFQSSSTTGIQYYSRPSKKQSVSESNETLTSFKLFDASQKLSRDSPVPAYMKCCYCRKMFSKDVLLLHMKTCYTELQADQQEERPDAQDKPPDNELFSRQYFLEFAFFSLFYLLFYLSIQVLSRFHFSLATKRIIRISEHN